MFKGALLKCVKFYQHAFEYNQSTEKPFLNSTGMKDKLGTCGSKRERPRQGISRVEKEVGSDEKEGKTKTKTKTKRVMSIGSSKSGRDEREGVAGALLEKVSITPQSRSSLSSCASHKAEGKYFQVSSYALNQHRCSPGFCRYQACSLFMEHNY